MTQSAKRLKKYGWYVAAIGTLLLVLATYARPDLVGELANLVWLCLK